MLMHLIRMKMIVAALLVSCMVLNGADEKPVLHIGFDNENPGSFPSKWGYAWGKKPEDHLVYISNAEHVSLKQCLIISAASTPSQWAMGAQVSNITEGWAVFSFCFKIHGSGTDVAIGFRVIDSSGLGAIGFSAVSLGNKRVTFGKDTLLGAWQEDIWHRVILWLPTQGGKQQMAHGLLQRQKPDMTWEEAGKLEGIPATPPPGYGSLQLLIYKNNFTACFDDFIILQQKTLEIPDVFKKEIK